MIIKVGGGLEPLGPIGVYAYDSFYCLGHFKNNYDDDDDNDATARLPDCFLKNIRDPIHYWAYDSFLAHASRKTSVRHARLFTMHVVLVQGVMQWLK